MFDFGMSVMAVSLAGTETACCEDLFLGSVAPQGGHILKGLALGLGYEACHKPCGEHADDAVEGVCEAVAELISHAGERHVVHRYEGRRYDEVEDPLECHGDGHRLRAYGVREDLGDKYPAYRTP